MNFEKIGVLSLQGAFAPHFERYREAGVAAHEVRRPEDLRGVDLLILPGGESTTQSHLLRLFGLDRAIVEAYEAGRLHLFGTCAGAVLLGRNDGAPPPRLGLLDIDCSRNAYGSQVDSFVADVVISKLGLRYERAPFIRAPRITRVGSQVEVLAYVGGDPVLVRSGRIAAATFHAELLLGSPPLPSLVFGLPIPILTSSGSAPSA